MWIPAEISFDFFAINAETVRFILKRDKNEKIRVLSIEFKWQARYHRSAELVLLMKYLWNKTLYRYILKKSRSWKLCHLCQKMSFSFWFFFGRSHYRNKWIVCISIVLFNSKDFRIPVRILKKNHRLLVLFTDMLIFFYAISDWNRLWWKKNVPKYQHW